MSRGKRREGKNRKKTCQAEGKRRGAGSGPREWLLGHEEEEAVTGKGEELLPYSNNHVLSSVG